MRGNRRAEAFTLLWYPYLLALDDRHREAQRMVEGAAAQVSELRLGRWLRQDWQTRVLLAGLLPAEVGLRRLRPIYDRAVADGHPAWEVGMLSATVLSLTLEANDTRSLPTLVAGIEAGLGEDPYWDIRGVGALARATARLGDERRGHALAQEALDRVDETDFTVLRAQTRLAAADVATRVGADSGPRLVRQALDLLAAKGAGPALRHAADQARLLGLVDASGEPTSADDGWAAS